VKAAFRVLKLKFLAGCIEQAFYPLHKQNIARDWLQDSTFLQAFRSVPGCQTCMCKRGNPDFRLSAKWLYGKQLTTDYYNAKLLQFAKPSNF